MSFNYRFSVIPAGAIIDARLTPRALQVLCLLGRHTNDSGWCSRSQVKMAKELGCGRSTIYDALELCYEAGWVERKRNGRGSTSAESSEYAFAAYSYRVILDRDDLPSRLSENEPPTEEAPTEPEGAAIAAGGAVQAAGGAAMAAPLEGDSSKGISSEPERETRAREDGKRPSVKRFLLKWPTAAIDDKAHTTKAWDALPDDQCEAAITGIDAFIAELKRHGRKHVPAGWKYLEDRSWNLIEKPEQVLPENVFFNCWSKEWWAVLLAKIERREAVSWMVKYAADRGSVATSEPSKTMPGAERLADFKNYPSDGSEMAAWRPWFERHGVKLPHWEKRIWVFLPSPSPAGITSTGPPKTLCTEQDLKDFTK